MPKIIDLSQAYHPGMPVYPGDPNVDIRTVGTVAKDHFTAKWLGLPSHAGTHVDVPAHMLEDGPGIDAIPANHFVGTAAVIQVPQGPITPSHLDDVSASVDFILFNTGWDKHWGTDRYYDAHPYLTPETAERLTGMNLKGVGMDFPSPDPVGVITAHHLLFHAGMIVVENLRGLDALPDSGFTFSCLPIKIAQGDGAPCRAVGMTA